MKKINNNLPRGGAEWGRALRRFLSDNIVPIMFVLICAYCIPRADLSWNYLLNEGMTRLVRNAFLILSLLIPVMAGMGMNFGMTLGAMAGQIGLIFAADWQVWGIPGLILAAIISIPISVLLGIMIGKLLNRAKGREMITSYIISFFINGVYQLVVLYMMGSIIPIKHSEIKLPRGYGIRNTVSLLNMRQCIDNLLAINVNGVKIPVLAIDTNFDQAETFIGTAHEDAAYEGGKYVAEKIGKGGKVVILANIQGESTSEARVAGYKKALEEGGCEIISTQYTDGVGDKAVTVTDGVLQSFADIDAIVCCADDVALGASRAIKQAGRDGDGIIVCGFDGISSGVQAVVDGEISCTVAQDPYNMGYQCVESLLDVVEGEKLDDFIDTGCKVITSDNADEYLAKLKSLV